MTIGTRKIKQRIAVAGFRREHLAYENQVIAAVERRLVPAFENGERAVQDGRASQTGTVVEPGKTVRQASGKTLRKIALRLI